MYEWRCRYTEPAHNFGFSNMHVTKNIYLVKNFIHYLTKKTAAAPPSVTIDVRLHRLAAFDIEKAANFCHITCYCEMAAEQDPCKSRADMIIFLFRKDNDRTSAQIHTDYFVAIACHK
jgi:hypothetical protein